MSKSTYNDSTGTVEQKRAPIDERRPSATAAARARPLSAEKNQGASRRRAQQETDAAGTTLNNSTTKHTNVHNQTTQADDIAQGASKNNATKWWRRGFQVEPSYKIGNPSTAQENAESSMSTLGVGLISRPQLGEFQNSTAEVDSILISNPLMGTDRLLIW